MNKLFTINNKELHDINTTILITSKTKYNNDIIELINNGCEVITKDSNNSISDLSLEILENFNCMYLKNKNDITKIDEIKINILSTLISNKKNIVFINVLTYVDNEFKRKLIKELKKQDKRIINYTSEIEETLLLDYLLVLRDTEIIMEGLTKEILKEEKILKKLGFNLPFIVELSNGLQYYRLINKTHYVSESLVNTLWK